MEEIIEEDGYFSIRIPSDYSLKNIIETFKEATKDSVGFKEYADKPNEELLPIVRIYIRTCGCHADVYISKEED
jgi:hypothetical protein